MKASMAASRALALACLAITAIFAFMVGWTAALVSGGALVIAFFYAYAARNFTTGLLWGYLVLMIVMMLAVTGTHDDRSCREDPQCDRRAWR